MIDTSASGKHQLIAVAVIFTAGLSQLTAQARNRQQADDPVEEVTREDVPLGERLSVVNDEEARARGVYRQVQNMLEQARQEKDNIKITCLDDKLTQIHTNLRGIEERKPGLDQAVASGDRASADHQFAMLNTYVAKINALQAEAERCVGDSDIVLGESENSLSVDEDVSEQDPARDSLDTYQNIGTDQLPHASGYF